jgi:hypothetical protein
LAPPSPDESWIRRWIRVFKDRWQQSVVAKGRTRVHDAAAMEHLQHELRVVMTTHAVVDTIWGIVYYTWRRANATEATVRFAIAAVSWHARSPTAVIDYVVALIDFEMVWAGASALHTLVEIIEALVAQHDLHAIVWYTFISSVFEFVFWTAYRWRIARASSPPPPASDPRSL